MDGKAMSHLSVKQAAIAAGISRSLATIIVSTAALMSGCVPMPQEADAAFKAAASQAGRERTMREHWVDKPYRELVQYMGREGLVMDIPRYGWPPSSAVGFGVDDVSGCVDAFLVIHGKEPLIKDYFCR